jgi:hypothetical protein
MNFSVKERLGIKLIAPANGSLKEQQLVRNIFEKIEFDILERSIISLVKQSNGDITWDVDKEKPKEVNFTQEEITLLKNQVELLDEKKLISQDTLDACLKIKSV